MDKLKDFWAVIDREMTVTLATAAEGRVTLRAVSPVRYGDAVLIFTAPGSVKYAQLRKNPRCALAAGPYYAEAEASFRGPSMAAENAELRRAYRAKFPGAFAEGDLFGGRTDEFLLLRPTRLSGWGYENGTPSEDGVPTVPFELLLP